MTRLTNTEKKAVRGALNYYIYEATHEGEFAGLPEGKEKKDLLSAKKKLKLDDSAKHKHN